jgi:hypothetical protein
VVKLARLDGGTPATILSYSPILLFRLVGFSPDSSSVIYETRSGSQAFWTIYSYAVATGTTTLLASNLVSPNQSGIGVPVTFAGGRALWSNCPGGNSSYTCTLSSAQLPAGPTTTLATGVTGAINSWGFQVAPDESRAVAYWYDTTVKIVSVPVAGGAQTTLTTDPVDVVGITPDSASVLIRKSILDSASQTYTSELSRLPITGGATAPLFSGAGILSEARLSPDGAYIQGSLYTGSNWNFDPSKFTVFSLPIGGGSTVPFTGLSSSNGFLFDSTFFSPDGSLTCFVQYEFGTNTLRCAPTAGGAAASIAVVDSSILPTSNHSVAFAANNQWIAWKNPSGRLATASVTGGTVTTPLSGDLRAVYSLSGNRVLAVTYNSPSYDISTVDVVTGAVSLVVAGVDAYAFSSDLSRVAYRVQSSSTLFEKSISGGAATAVSSYAGSDFAFASPSRLVFARWGTPSPFNFQDGLYSLTLP